jgi:hypothetical protein
VEGLVAATPLELESLFLLAESILAPRGVMTLIIIMTRTKMSSLPLLPIMILEGRAMTTTRVRLQRREGSIANATANANPAGLLLLLLLKGGEGHPAGKETRTSAPEAERGPVVAVGEG